MKYQVRTLEKIVRTRYVLGVKSTCYVCTSTTYSYKSNSHFISGTITLAAVTSLLPTRVRRFAGRILPIRSLLDWKAAKARLCHVQTATATCDLIDIAATPAILCCCVCTTRRETWILVLAVLALIAVQIWMYQVQRQEQEISQTREPYYQEVCTATEQYKAVS